MICSSVKRLFFEAGRKVQEVTRKMGVSEVTFYRWKAKFGGMNVSESPSSPARGWRTGA